MSKSKRPHLSHSDQAILINLRVHRLDPGEETERCDALITKHHYLRSATLVGEHMRYVATYKGEWLALASWSSAAFHLRDRDEFIGWNAEQCRRRLPLMTSNSRLLVLPGSHSPNLISRFMKLMFERLSIDWEEKWGHPIAMVESFVDPRLFQGTGYKASGWSHLGKTSGWKRDASDFYQKHDAPKEIWVRELTKNARVKLRSEKLPPEWECAELARKPRCTATSAELRCLMELLRDEVADFRRAQSLGFGLAGMLALIVMAMVTGVRLGPDDLAQYAETLSQAQLRALRFCRDKHTGKTRCPKKTTFHRILSRVDAAALDKALLIWQRQVLGPSRDDLVIVDGKKMRHGGVEIVNACDGRGRYLGSVMTPDKSNEVPAARELLGRIDLVGKTVLTDALHTVAETGAQIVHDQGGHYLMTVKGNQPILQKTLEKLFEKTAFSP